MHRMMSPLPFFIGSKSSNNRSMTQSQNATLSSKEKKYMSNVEKALQSFESVDEWADYIAFLAKLQKALLSNPDLETTNWIPYDFQVSMTLSKCTSSSLPSGVHKKTIELYVTVFNILKTENMSKSITLWLPGILPLMSYASISIKQELLNLYTDFICKIDSKTIRACFKSILLSLFPALDDTTSEFFNATLDLIEALKIQLNDKNHFWQCLLLTIITSPDKRVGAMEYMTRKFPLFTLSYDTIEKGETFTRDTILSSLDEDAVACLTPDSGLLVKALCEALNDSNLFVQRGFFDLLLAKLPLNSPLYVHIFSESDIELLFLYSTKTVLRKDMSLNRRLWSWLLGPDSQDGLPTTSSMTKLQYFQKFGLKSLLNALIGLVQNNENISKDELFDNYIKVCSISIAIMDKWEIGQSILPRLFIPILEKSYFIADNYPSDFDKLIKYSNEVFDGVETGLIWATILDLIQAEKINLVIFILKSYNVSDEDMVITHVPLILLTVFTSFKYETKWIQLMEYIVKILPQRALLPLNLAEKKYLSLDCYISDKSILITEINSKLLSYYSTFKDVSDEYSSSVERPFKTEDLAALYLGFTSKIIIESLNKSNSTIFLSATKIFDLLIQIIPPSDIKVWDTSIIRENIKEKNIEFTDIEIAFGITNLFKYLIKDLNKLQTLKLLKIVTKSLWRCLEQSNGKYQVEIVKKFWNLEMIVSSVYIEAAFCELLLELDFEERLYQFNILWIHLNSDNHESKMVLHRPLFLILQELQNDIYLSSINKWIRSTISSGTLNKIFRIISMELFNNEFLNADFKSYNGNINVADFTKISFEMEVIYNLLNLDSDILNNFKVEMCVIDSSKQIEFIQARNSDISSYKSFLIVVLTKFIEIQPANNLIKYNDIYSSYLKCIRLSLKLITLLVDGNETNFNEIVLSLVENCEENCMSVSGSNISIINSYYLESIIKMIKLSSKNQKRDFSIFDSKDKERKTINLLDFITIGISSCKKSNEFSNWIELVLSTSEYYPDLIFQICPGLVTCICNKIEISFLPAIEDIDKNIALVEEPICELIIGMEKILMKCHKHLGYLMSNNFAFGNISNPGSVKESGFFGTVIQGVFQVEATGDKNEMNKRKRSLIESFRRSIFTVYKIWIGSENRSSFSNEDTNEDTNEFVGKLNDKKTMNYCSNKVRFRCKKIIENNYLMEPLETIETLIECNESSSNENNYGFKLIQILDDCKQKIILSYILDSIISRVNFISLDETRRSTLTSKLNETQICSFLIEYCKNFEDFDQISEVWIDIQNFLKDVFSNVSYYKHIYPNILKFYTLIGWKTEKTSFGQSKRINKEISENIVKIITQCITIKIGSNQNTLSSVILSQNVDFDEKGSNATLNSGSSRVPQEKVIFREEVCIALQEVIPRMKLLINESDKLLTTMNSIISGINGFLLKNGSLIVANLNDYMIDLLAILSEDETCKNMKVWKSLCNDIINDDNGFFTKEVGNNFKWKRIMKNWILNDDEKLADLINNKLIFTSLNSAGTSLFNWNDEVEILNGNIPTIKKIIYLILINEKDEFIRVTGYLFNKLDELFKAFREITKQHCQLESWILILLRCMFFKFSENHLIEAWTLVNKELFYLFNEGYQKVIEDSYEEEDNISNSITIPSSEKRDEMDETVFNNLFLEGCKLLDVLVLLGQEEFQLSEWIFLNDNMDGIYGKPGEDIGIIEKISNCRTKFKIGKDGLIDENSGNDQKTKSPLLEGITQIENLMDLKKFYNLIKIRKYENEYEMKAINSDSITEDIFNDIFM